VHDVEHAGGRPASPAVGEQQRGRRIALGRLQHEAVLPQAMAIGNIHIGTIAGKLNGVMPATTPSGWRMIGQLLLRPLGPPAVLRAPARVAEGPWRDVSGHLYRIGATGACRSPRWSVS
jgi:hypothetical protein